MVISEFDPELVGLIARLHEGNAEAHLKRVDEQFTGIDAHRVAWSQDAMIAASSLAISASYWTLTDARKAVELFRRAAEAYRRLRHEYWVVLALAAGDKASIAQIPGLVAETREPQPQTLAFALVAEALLGVDDIPQRDNRHEEYRMQFGNPPIGRLQVPLDSYRHSARAMRATRRRGADALLPLAAKEYVRRATEVVRAASHDRFHWKQLHSAILPVEPEAAAMVVSLSAVSHEVLNEPINNVEDVDQHGRMLLRAGDALWEAAQASKHDSGFG